MCLKIVEQRHESRGKWVLEISKQILTKELTKGTKARTVRELYSLDED